MVSILIFNTQWGVTDCCVPSHFKLNFSSDDVIGFLQNMGNLERSFYLKKLWRRSTSTGQVRKTGPQSMEHTQMETKHPEVSSMSPQFMVYFVWSIHMAGHSLQLQLEMTEAGDVGKYQEKGMLLPFRPLTIAFENIRYSVDMPQVNNSRWLIFSKLTTHEWKLYSEKILNL